MIQSVSSIIRELQSDNSSRQHLRDIYKEHIQSHGTDKPLMLFVDAEVAEAQENPDGKVHLLFTNILIRRMDTGHLYETLPVISMVDHLNCFTLPTISEHYQLDKKVGQRVVMIGRAIVYRRGNSTLDVSIQVMTPSAFYMGYQTLRRDIDNWHTHLATHGIHESKHLHEKIKCTLYGMRKTREDKKYLYIPIQETQEEVASKIKQMIDEYKDIKSRIHQPLLDQYLAEKHYAKEDMFIDHLKEVLPRSLVLA